MNVAGFVIHLERAEARRANVQEIIDSCPVPASIQRAADGRSLSAGEIARFYRGRIHSPRYPFELRNGEVATFMSHRSCWRRLLDERLDAALVMEDDIRIGGGEFADALALALEHVESLGCIQFATRPPRTRCRRVGEVSRPGMPELLEPLVVPLGMRAQLVSRAAAERLLAATSRIDRPIDTFLQLRETSGVRVFTTWPSGVSEVSSELGGSTIHSRRKRELWLKREWDRFVYAQQMRRLPAETG